MARTKQAVPAAKISLAKLYAIKTDEGLRPFKPSKVIVTRHNETGSPHDYETTVTGWKQQFGDEPPEMMTLPAARILGEFTEYQELVAERKRQEQEHNRKLEEAKAEALELQALLYKVAGLKHLGEVEDYKQPIRLSFSDELTITREARKPLLDALKLIEALKATA